MIIIGERINSSRKAVKEAIEKRDIAFLIDEARRQTEAGAHYLDINCATAEGSEEENIKWLVENIQKEISAPFCIDSPDPKAIEAALSVNKNGPPFINSITAEKGRSEKILPLAKKHKAKVIALTMGASEMPKTAGERAGLAGEILKIAKRFVPEEDIYFDPLVKPVSSEPDQGREFLEALRLIKSLGNVRTIGGLSNISFGLPNRKLLNKTFLSMAIACGIDAVIIDPLDKESMASLTASTVLTGKDDYCMNYITRFREGKL